MVTSAMRLKGDSNRLAELQCRRMCRGIGDLILVYKRITGLAGHTSRVAELLEQVCTAHSPSF